MQDAAPQQFTTFDKAFLLEKFRGRGTPSNDQLIHQILIRWISISEKKRNSKCTMNR